MRFKLCTISLTLITLLLPLLVMSQPNTEDVIYFKNGGILRGEIIEYPDDESLKIKTVGRNVIVVRLEEVNEIKKEKIPVAHYFKTSGYVNQTGIAILPGSDNTPVRFQMVHGYQFTSRFSAGLGIGFTLYNDPLDLIPFFIDLRYKFLAANTTPFVFFKSGHSFSILSDDHGQIEDHRGGFMLNPGAGLQFETKAGFGLYFTAGYNLDNSNFQQDGWGGRIINNDISHRRILFGFGLSF